VRMPSSLQKLLEERMAQATSTVKAGGDTIL
jgi:hypothetical protein